MVNSDSASLRSHLLEGQVIPACPLALKADGKWSERHQLALLRYYHASGAGGLAVGVHSTQFAIRDPGIHLFKPLLKLVAAERDHLEPGKRPFILIAGVCGSGDSARSEAYLAAELGYDAAMISPSGWSDRPEETFLTHCRDIADILPILGFYLQPSVGGRHFSPGFWQELAAIPNLVSIKVAPFNRYRTLDVARALIESGRNDVALYTGNDDNIIFDLLTRHHTPAGSIGCSGGLLGQWGVWTSRAVEMLEQIKHDRNKDTVELERYEKLSTAITDANAVIFDVSNDFRGCIPGIMEVLRRQGLVPSNRCLDPNEVLSPGQAEELDRIAREYPFLHDNDFIAAHIEDWLK